MKQLTLLRHGKSVQDPAYATDRERPLADRGRRDAALLGKFFSQAGVVPDLIVSSPVVRARQTAELFAKAAGYPSEIRWEEAIYAEDVDGLLAVVRSLPDTATHVLLIGHNPGFEDLVAILVGAGAATEGGRVVLATATAAHLELNADHWSDARAGAGLLQWLLTPRLLKAAE